MTVTTTYSVTNVLLPLLPATLFRFSTVIRARHGVYTVGQYGRSYVMQKPVEEKRWREGWRTPSLVPFVCTQKRRARVKRARRERERERESERRTVCVNTHT